MSPRPPELTLCMIVRDEERFLPACLASATPLVDEIVVVDTGSSDRSVEVARAAGARVIEEPWRDDFSRARNASLEAARGRWVLVLDADERLEPCTRARLDEAIAACGSVEALTVEIRSDLAGGASQSTHILRLFSRRPEHRYEGRIHEQIAASIARRCGLPAISPRRSPLVARHLGYRPDLLAARNKKQRNETLLRAQVRDAPDDPAGWYLLGRELMTAAGGDLLACPANREALAALARARRLAGDAELAHHLDRDLRAARLHLLAGDAAAARSLLDALPREARATLPALAARGEWELEAGSKARGLELFQRCLEASPEAGPLGDVDPRWAGSWAHERIGRAHLRAGRVAAAAEAAARARRTGPTEAGPALLEARIAHREGDSRGALATLVQAARQAPHDPRPHLAMAEILFALHMSDPARTAARTALKIAPGWESPRALLERHGGG
ncbi:MAG: glycosyltransferase [Acidobacteriota bacterium]|nr:glycosyltransferase [Acidobacteriota bacterium]MDQ7088275.1 glycosyltransferase [Acidobacteriota bacterium]